MNAYGNFLRLTILFFTAVLLTACYRAWVSQASIQDTAEWKSRDNIRARTLTNVDITIAIKASNVVSAVSKPEEDYLGISLRFEPRTNTTFDPYKTILILPNGTRVNPSRVHIQIAGDNSRLNTWVCGQYVHAEFEREPPYKLYKGSCFDLYFDIPPPNPDREFKMLIGGLSRQEFQIAVPTVVFKKGFYWTFDFLGM